MKLKEKINKIFNGEYRGIAILFILQFILTITIKPIRYDDAFYIEAITGVPILSFVGSRYLEWTSRILIEFTLGIIFRFSKYIWIFGNAIMVTLIGYSISKIFVKKEMKKEMNMMILWLVILYPFERMSSAGWAATTVNYIWPMSLGLYSLISIRYAWDKKKITPFQGILFALSTVYACNQEQCCAIILATYLLFTIILTVRDKKKVSTFMYLQTIIAIISIIFILINPGNAIRKQDEIVAYFPEYNSISFIDKLVLGVTSTMGELLVNYSVTFAIFSFMICVFIWMNYKDRLIRGISAIPLTATLVLSYFSSFTENTFITIKWIRKSFVLEDRLITPYKYTYLGSYMELVISLAVIFSIMICLLLIFKKLKNNIAIYIFGAGLVSRLIMGLSPTLFVSTNRTFIIMEFACIICTLLIWQELTKTIDKKYKTRIYNVVVWTSIVQYIASLGFVLISHIGV